MDLGFQHSKNVRKRLWYKIFKIFDSFRISMAILTTSKQTNCKRE